MKQNNISLTIPINFKVFLLISLLVHIFLLNQQINISNSWKVSNKRKDDSTKLIVKIRKIGNKDVQNNINSFFIPQASKKLNLSTLGTDKIGKMNKVHNIGTKSGKEVSLSDLNVVNSSRDYYKKIAPRKAIHVVGSKTSKLKDALKQGNSDLNAGAYSQLGHSSINIDVEVPNGAKVNELNAHELVFYGFLKRIWEKYINTLNNHIVVHNQKNPHYKFPIEKKKKTTMAFKVTYDKNGEVIRVRAKRWSRNPQLQKFFEETMVSLGKVTNPPKPLSANAKKEFSVTYTLVIDV